MTKNIELLAPAGNYGKLQIALIYGADAVYVGGEAYGLRAGAANFTEEEMKKGLKLTHSMGKKIFVTMNIIARNEDLEGMAEYASELEKMGVDGVIVSDPGVFYLVKEIAPKLEIHISTQANNLNWRTCKAWYEQGAKRVNIARELSLKEITEIRKNVPEELELEAFVHGAMCISFSGRCLLSDYMINRPSNRGECAQPCRWNYSLQEEKRPGEYMPVFENERGTYIFNSKDLCMIESIPELVNAGITSMKIEGRMKSEYYTAIVVRAYRKAIDSYLADPEKYVFKEEWLRELETVSHRQYSTGFYQMGDRGQQVYSTSSYCRSKNYIGMVLSCNQETGEAIIIQRNNFGVGDTIEVVTPGDLIFEQKLTRLEDEKGNAIESAPHAMMMVKIKLDHPVPENSILRR